MGVAYLDLSVSYLQHFVIATLYHFTFVCGAQLDDALRYEPGGRGFEFRWCHWNFSLTILPTVLSHWVRLSPLQKLAPGIFPGG